MLTKRMYGTIRNGEVHESYKEEIKGLEEHKFIIQKPCGHTEVLKTYASPDEDPKNREYWDQKFISGAERGIFHPLRGQCDWCYDNNPKSTTEKEESTSDE